MGSGINMLQWRGNEAEKGKVQSRQVLEEKKSVRKGGE